jgi:hypothetical protein
MSIDARGLEVSAASPEAVEAVNDFTARLVRIDRGVEAILPAAERWPDVPIIRLLAAAFYLFGQTGDAVRLAASHLDAVEPLLSAANARERQLHAALRLWLANDNLRAVEAFEALTAQAPTDLLAAKCAEFLYYVLGQQHMGARFRAHMERIEPANANDPDFLSMAAFASELCGDFADAERRSERSIELAERNPWAQHALAHVLIRQGRVDEGKAKMEAFLPQLATCGRPIHSHDAWHLALLHLEELDVPRAMEVFRGHIWGITPGMVVEQLDAISLLWRIELAGTPMDAEWASIAEQVEPRATETFMPFMNAHYVYALARAGRAEAVESALASVRARSGEHDAEARRVWAPAGRAIVEAAAKFGSGDRAGAAEWLEPAMPDMTRIGGSDAQDDLFRQTFLRALLAAGREVDAAAYFERIMGDKRRTPLDHALARA